MLYATSGLLQEYIDRYYNEYGRKPPMPIDEMTGRELEEGDEFIVVGKDAEDLRGDLSGASFFSAYEAKKAEKALKSGTVREMSDEALYAIGNLIFALRLELDRLGQVAD